MTSSKKAKRESNDSEDSIETGVGEEEKDNYRQVSGERKICLLSNRKN